MKNKGLAQYRFKQNTLEKKFAEAWDKENSGRVSGRGFLDYLLAKDPNRPEGEVTDRDRAVAATVIQWIGSPVGQCFIDEVMTSYQATQFSKRHVAIKNGHIVLKK